MAKEYIEREAANNWICETCDGCEGTFCAPCDGNPLKDIPAADVVKVVRCRECKHSVMYKFTYNYERVLACNAPGVTMRAVKPMHFCADGKRKDGGNDDA